MKNIKQLLLAGVVCSMLAFGACSPDEGGDPTPAAKTCKVTKTTSDGENVTYTYDGNNLTKVVESDGYTYDYAYVSGQLTEITEDDGTYKTTYKVSYTGGKVSRVDVYDDVDLVSYFTVALNADGTLKVVEEFMKDTPTDLLYSRYSYTYKNGVLDKLVQIEDADDDGVLSEVDDDVSTLTILTLDGKKNPYYGLPVYLIDFSDLFALTPSNINAVTIDFAGTPIPAAITYEYTAENYPSKQTLFVFGDTAVVDFTYMCN